MAICRLLYVSKKARNLEITDFRDLAYVSNEKNLKRGIAGILCYQNGNFMQLLEGPPREVNDLFRNILNDERHHLVTLLDYQLVPCQTFPRWGMKYVQFEDFNVPSEYRDACIKSEYSPFPMNPGLALEIIYNLRDLDAEHSAHGASS